MRQKALRALPFVLVLLRSFHHMTRDVADVFGTLQEASVLWNSACEEDEAMMVASAKLCSCTHLFKLIP